MRTTLSDEGGPAFPSMSPVDPDGGILVYTGITVRDYFAAAALAEVPDPLTVADAPATARLAFAIADAMLAERRGGVMASVWVISGGERHEGSSVQAIVSSRTVADAEVAKASMTGFDYILAQEFTIDGEPTGEEIRRERS